MEREIVIVGAGGHGMVVADLAETAGRSVKGFLDDERKTQGPLGYPILGKSRGVWKEKYAYLVAIGDNVVRRRIAERHGQNQFVTLIHRTAVLGREVSTGEGTVLLAGVLLNTGARVGKHCILNTGCIVEHECCIGNYCHISPGAVLAGQVIVGEECQIGAGAVVRNHIRICDHVTVGAGAVVVKDILEPGIYVGVPAEKKVMVSDFLRKRM